MRDSCHRIRAATLWADWIRINQVEDEEKSWQVRMMDVVYRIADRVIIWLGPDEYDDVAAMEHFVPQIVEGARTRRNWSSTALPAWENGAGGAQTAVQDPAEIPLRVFHGDQPTSCMSLHSILESFQEAFEFLSENFIFPPVPDTDDAYYCIDPLLLTTERFLNHSQAPDPRDKVYALKGLATDADEMEIDYAKSVSQVCYNAAFAMLQSSHALVVFSVAAIHPKTVGPHFPS